MMTSYSYNMSDLVFIDVECYTNYFLICMKYGEKISSHEMYAGKSLDKDRINSILCKFTTVGFNSNNYDLPIINQALSGTSNAELKKFSDDIIVGKKKAWQISNNRIPQEWKHIDLIEPSPSVATGLKMYGARMHTDKIQDLPIEPDSLITSGQRDLLKLYCINDLKLTEELYNKIKDRIQLRKSLEKLYPSLSLCSKSDAQVAESIIKYKLKLTQKPKLDINSVYKYELPNFISFDNPDLQLIAKEIADEEFKLNNAGRLINSYKKKIKLGSSQYSIGIGGIHSTEKSTNIIKRDDQFLVNFDVSSYYPSIIILNNYSPFKENNKFIELYKTFYYERLKAKKEGDKIKNEGFKIILNGSYGKFGSVHSYLYSPSLLLHTTITGQLSILMLIDRLESKGFSVVSANTDGITVLGSKELKKTVNDIVDLWEIETGFNMEETSYKAIYYQSVNSYISIKDNGDVNSIGSYDKGSLSKNPAPDICIDAIVNYIKFGKNIEDTISQEKDIRKFIMVRNVTGGALYKNNYLGKVVRWFYGNTEEKIVYKKNGNKVAGSDGAIPIMDIDLNKSYPIHYETYINNVKKMINWLGIKYGEC